MNDERVKGGLERSSKELPGEVVYVVPARAFDHRKSDEINLFDMWAAFWRNKWLIIAITASFAVVSVAYALAQTHWYRSDVLLSPSESKSAPSLGGQLGGLASLAGVSVGGDDSVVAIATLRSRDFAKEFIQDFDLMKVFFSEQWSAERNDWSVSTPEDVPDIRDAVKFFHDNVLSVVENNQAGLVTLSVEWKDPELAADWAGELVRRLNASLRERELQMAEKNIANLTEQLAQATVLPLQQSIARLLESELQKEMLARGNEEFAFRIIDGPHVPAVPSKPRRSLIAIMGTMAGGLFAVLIVVVREFARKQA